MVVGRDIPNLKQGAIYDFRERVLIDYPVLNSYVERWNITERKAYFSNGSELVFTSFENEQAARSGKRDIAFFNEADGIPYPIYEQVARRTEEEIYIDYNPASEFWVHDHVIVAGPHVDTFYSNYTHNPYASKEIIQYEILPMRERDPIAWRVYGLGKTGDILETIFDKYEVVPTMPDNFRKQGYGQDFGYVADPTTLVHCGLKNERDLYLDEIIHGYKMKASDIDGQFREKGVSRQLKILADNSHEYIIDDLQAMNWRIEGVKKREIAYGISLLKDYNLFITERSYNILNERKRYRWKLDKNTGKITNEPIDAWNHCWDAIRYWAVDNLRPLRRPKGIKRRG